jgi:hypothetical protein
MVDVSTFEFTSAIFTEITKQNLRKPNEKNRIFLTLEKKTVKLDTQKCKGKITNKGDFT